MNRVVTERALAGLAICAALTAVAVQWHPQPTAEVTAQTLPVTVPERITICPGQITVPPDLTVVDPEATTPAQSTVPASVGIGGQLSVTAISPGPISAAITSTALQPAGAQSDATTDPTETDPWQGVLAIDSSTGWRTSAIPEGQLQSGSQPVTPTQLTAASGGRKVPNFAGTVHIAVPNGDYQGVAFASCFPPQEQTLLLAGSSAAGRHTKLVVTNPSGSAITADITVLTSTAGAEPAATKSVSLPAHGTVALSLNTLVPAQATFAVQVIGRGGNLASYLEHTQKNQDAPAGIAFTTPAAAPSDQLIFPGVLGDPKASGAVRLYNPNDQPAVVALAALGESGGVLPLPTSATVPAKSVVDLDLPQQFPVGVGALVVTSDQPLAGAVSMALVTGATAAETTQPDNPFTQVPQQSTTYDLTTINAATPVPPGAVGKSVLPFSVALPVQDVVDVAVMLPPESAGTDTEPGIAQVYFEAIRPDGSFAEPQLVQLPHGSTKRFTPSDFGPGATAVQVWTDSGPGVYLQQAVQNRSGWAAATWYPPPAPPRPLAVRVVS